MDTPSSSSLGFATAVDEETRLELQGCFNNPRFRFGITRKIVNSFPLKSCKYFVPDLQGLNCVSKDLALEGFLK